MSEEEELYELADGNFVPRFAKCTKCGSDIDRTMDGMAVEVDGKPFCLECAGRGLGTDLRGWIKDDGDDESEDDGVESFEEESDNDEETATEDDSEDSEVSEDVETEEVSLESPVIENKEESNTEDVQEPESVSESKSDSVTGKLADETHSEIKEDVGWFKKKTKEKIVDDPDSFRERWRRARLLRHGYVILRTLRRDAETGDFIRESTLVKKSDLPQSAVQCTNEKGYYCYDMIKESEWYQQSRDDLGFDFYESQFTASDAALYMVSNKIDNALITKWTDFSHIDMKKVILPIAAVVCIIIFFVIRGL